MFSCTVNGYSEAQNNMEMKVAILRCFPSIIAVCSLLGMYAFLRIDAIVTQTLYSYGLQYNSSWAIPYFGSFGIIVMTGWIIFSLSVALQAYLLISVKLVARKKKH